MSLLPQLAKTLSKKPDLPIYNPVFCVKHGDWQLDLISNKLQWSDDQYRIYGYEPSEFKLDNKFFITKTTHSNDVDRITKLIEHALKEQNYYNFKRCIVKKSGALGYVETTAEIIRAEDGKPTKIIGITVDIIDQSPPEINEFNDALFFKNLFSNYKKAIFSEIFKQIREKDISKDLCQEVFIKAWKNISQYDAQKGQLYTWLINIAKNHCKDYFRSKYYKSNKITSSIDYIHEFTLRFESFDLERLDFINLLSQLPPSQKEIIEMLFWQGFTHEEVAKITGLPLGTVKTRSRSAIIALRKLVAVA